MPTETACRTRTITQTSGSPFKMPPTRHLRNTQTPDTRALNAAVFGFAGHSLATPHTAISRLWWTEDRIKRTVTTEYISSRISLLNKSRLHKRPAFAKHTSRGCVDDLCLTDDIYLDWMLGRCRRLFLALQACGAADEIFAVVDAAWSDDDLPIAKDDVPFLADACSKTGGAAIDAGFFAAQFQYLLRELSSGADIDYGINEYIPIEFTGIAPAGGTLEPWFRIHLARHPGKIYVQRRTKFLDASTREASLAEWKAHVALQRRAKHPHIASIFASYTANSGTLAVAVVEFIPEHTLRSFIEHRTPSSIERCTLEERVEIILQWMGCLADAVAYMHRNDLPCPHITPSSILVDSENRIVFTEIGKSDCFQKVKTLSAAEIYCYEAPERQSQPIDALSQLSAINLSRSSSKITKKLKVPRRHRSLGDLRAARREAGSSRAGDLATEPDVPVIPNVWSSSDRNDIDWPLPLVRTSRMSTDWIKQIPYASAASSLYSSLTAMSPRAYPSTVGPGPPTPPPELLLDLGLGIPPMPSRPAPPIPFKLSIWPKLKPLPINITSVVLNSAPFTLPENTVASFTRPKTPAPLSPLTTRFCSGHNLPPSPPRSASTTDKPLPSLPSPSVSTSASSHYRDRDPEHASDIFSLGCVYLDMLTYLLGHRPYGEFEKFRSRSEPTSLQAMPSSTTLVARFSSSVSSSSSSLPRHPSTREITTTRCPRTIKKSTLDSSFHANPPRVASWITQLENGITIGTFPQHRKKSASTAKKDAALSSPEHNPLSTLTPILDLVRCMLSADALARPDAWELQTRLGGILSNSTAVGLPTCCGTEH